MRTAKKVLWEDCEADFRPNDVTFNEEYLCEAMQTYADEFSKEFAEFAWNWFYNSTERGWEPNSLDEELRKFKEIQHANNLRRGLKQI